MRILFFSPHAAIWDATLGETLVAHALTEKQHEVMIVSCGTFLKKYCVAMGARLVRHDDSEEKKREVCAQCTSNRSLLNGNFDLRTVNAEEFLTPGDYEFANQWTKKVTRENALDTVIDGIKVGRFAAYEVIIQNKKISMNLDEKQWSHYRDALENSILSLKAAQKAFEVFKPDRFIVFNSLYSMNNVWKAEAERREIPPYQICGPFGLADMGRKFTFFLDNGTECISFCKDTSEKWKIVSRVPVTTEQIQMVTSQFTHLFRGGSYVYSSHTTGVNVHDHLGLNKDKPLFIAVLSSPDEIMAAEVIGYPSFGKKQAFPSQIEWMESLVDFFSKKPDWQLLIRPHPRLFAMGGSNVIAEEIKRFQELFRKLPSNVLLNRPEDQLSMYDLAQEADVVLNAWSSVGGEMALLGVPVVQYVSYAWLPDGINHVAESPSEYFSLLESALGAPLDIKRIRAAFRFYRLLFDSAVIDLSKSFPYRGDEFWVKLKRKVLIPGLVGQAFKRKFLKKTIVTEAFERAELKACRIEPKQRDLINEILVNGETSPIAVRLKAGIEPLNSAVVNNEWLAIKKSLKKLAKISSHGQETKLTRRLHHFLQ